LIVEPQIWIPINYKGKYLGGKLKLDLLVEKLIVVENKAVESMILLYEARLLSYLKLANKPKGLLINFHSLNLSSQVVSLVTEEFAKLPEY
jgi:GxxExxY protein